MDPSQFEKMFAQANSIMGPFADMILQTARFPPANGEALVVLDQACGSGVVSSHIMSRLYPEDKARLDLTCADISEPAITQMRRRIEASGWNNARAVTNDAMSSDFPSSHFTHIFFNFGPQILPDPIAGLKECHRTLRPGGVLGLSAWQVVPWAADYRAGIATDPSLPAFPTSDQLRYAFSSTPEKWDTIHDVTKHLEDSGLTAIAASSMDNTTTMTIAEVEAMLPYSLDMMIQKFWTKEEVEKFKVPATKAIVSYLGEKYGTGPVVWKWVAVVACGKKE
ncbi:hypothetical protein H2200_004875 [Cladophialophora chaetospira]|uniref:Methyltransferase domain-containing protein n=1 Tax=Cladophialophora chaetospira TaxID=386627 RepID=A0AA38XDX1_9EURO|nr:hypothetical protein H2200_004875 [Cladophialophora chaetospira]